MIIAIVFASCGSNTELANGKQSQNIERLSQAEIDSCDTPRAAAYNFVMSIVVENYSQTVKLMSLDLFYEYMQTAIMQMIPNSELFSTKYMHKIVDMRPVVKMGYDVVITDVKAVDSTNIEESVEFRGKPGCIVSFDCANAKNKLYDGSKGDYDTSVKVYVVEEKEEWRVLGFK